MFQVNESTEKKIKGKGKKRGRVRKAEKKDVPRKGGARRPQQKRWLS